MSYARFGARGSDVYVFLSCGDIERPQGWLECCACALSEIDGGPYFWKAAATDAMLAHLAQHRRAGHVVPDHTIHTLEQDRAENDAILITCP